MYVCDYNVGVYIIDVDECEDPDVCSMNANCTNTIGSYFCTCEEGYTGNGTECEGMYMLYYVYAHDMYLNEHFSP